MFIVYVEPVLKCWTLSDILAHLSAWSCVIGVKRFKIHSLTKVSKYPIFGLETSPGSHQTEPNLLRVREIKTIIGCSNKLEPQNAIKSHLFLFSLGIFTT